jgi:hypothetical protein
MQRRAMPVLNGILRHMLDADDDSPPSLIRRLLANPLRLRAQSRLMLVFATLLAGVSRFVESWPGGFLTALLWIVVLPIALGIAMGDAFLVAHGRGRRRLIVTISAAVLVALFSCVLLASITGSSESIERDIVSSVVYGVFYAANIVGLSALIALAIGRGGDYVSRRIDAMSEEDW